MAKRIFNCGQQTFTATAVTTNLADTTYMGIQGGASTQLVDILEIMISGMATASTVAAMTFVPTSTAAATLSKPAPASDGPLNTSATALATVVGTYTTATTKPQASAVTTVPKINLGLNLFGGIIRWNAAPTQQYTLVGLSTATGDSVLYNSSTYGGSSGLANAHIIYEPY
jgi:hypothetical protein